MAASTKHIEHQATATYLKLNNQITKLFISRITTTATSSTRSDGITSNDYGTIPAIRCGAESTSIRWAFVAAHVLEGHLCVLRCLLWVADLIGGFVVVCWNGVLGSLKR